MYKKILLQADLTPSQAEILDYLYQNKEAKASEIAKKIKRSRAIVYKEGDELANIGVIERVDNPNQISIYRAKHPSELKKLLDLRENKLKKDRELLNSYLPDMVSGFNLMHNKPGMKIFEGIEGIKKVLDDTLYGNKNKQLLTFSDVAGYSIYLKDWNTNHYAPKRAKLGIYEKVIIPDDKKALDYMKNYQANDITDIIFIDSSNFPFKTEVNIYDDKVSFVTFSERGHIGVIIDNPEIAKTLTSIFNFCWQLGKKNLQSSQPEWMQKQWKK